MSELCGLLNVLKPVGCTSHDVVAMVRAVSGVKTGHAGTLDPAASGVLVMMLGAATRLSKYMVQADKSYRAEFTFGIRTDTYDNEGRIVDRASADGVCDRAVRTHLQAMTGELEMIPPPHSAVRVDGKRSYDLARSGRSAELPPRTVMIESAELLAYHPGAHPRALVEITCSKGTYIRSFAKMLGDRLGAGAYMSGLVRTRVGGFDICASTPPAAIERHGVSSYLIPPQEGIDMPQHRVAGEELRRARHGNRLYCDVQGDAGHYLLISDSAVVGVAERSADDRGTYLQPRTVFRTGDESCR